MSKIKYIAKGYLKHIEEDNFEEGCLPDTSKTLFLDTQISGDTIEELIDNLKAFVGVKNDADVAINACGQDGRIDIQRLETAYGSAPSQGTIEKWKLGNVKLYLCDYSFNVQVVSSDFRIVVDSNRKFEDQTEEKESVTAIFIPTAVASRLDSKTDLAAKRKEAEEKTRERFS